MWISDDGQYLYQLFGLSGEVGVYEITGAELTLIQEVGGLPANNTQGIVSVGQVNDNPIVLQDKDETPERIIDLDGPTAASRAEAQAFTDMAVYPNPTSGDILNVTFELQTATDFTLSVFSIDGSNRANFNTNVTGRSAGFYNERVDVSQFSNGVYIIQINNGQQIMHEKFIIQR